MTKWQQKHGGNYIWMCEKKECYEVASDLVYDKQRARYYYACKEDSEENPKVSSR